jgi:hypothetical protein
MRYQVTLVHEVEYRGASDGPTDVPWGNYDELGVVTAVAQILDQAREPGTGKFPSLKETTHGIRIELITEES